MVWAYAVWLCLGLDCWRRHFSFALCISHQELSERASGESHSSSRLAVVVVAHWGLQEGPGSDLICQFDNFTVVLLLQGIIGLQFSKHDGDRGFTASCSDEKKLRCIMDLSGVI